MNSQHTAEAGHADKADSPRDIRKPSWGYTFRRALREFMDDDCTDLAAALTYYSVLSIFPALIALVSLLSLVGQGGATDALITMAQDLVPEDTMQTLGPIIESLTTAPAPGIGLIIGLLVALWTASNYVTAFSRALNRVYEVEEGRPFWKLRPTMYLLTLVMLVLVAVGAIILVISGPIAATLGSFIGLSAVAVTVWNIAKWPVLLLVIVIAIALLFWATPNVRQPKFRWISTGAVIAIVVAIVASVVLGFYFANFGSYGETYGALGGVIMALLWIWVMNVALLFGAEFDAELERSRELQSGIRAEETIQLPARDTKASDKKAAKAKKDIARGRALRRSRGRTQDPDKVDDVTDTSHRDEAGAR